MTTGRKVLAKRNTLSILTMKKVSLMKMKTGTTSLVKMKTGTTSLVKTKTGTTRKMTKTMMMKTTVMMTRKKAMRKRTMRKRTMREMMMREMMMREMMKVVMPVAQKRVMQWSRKKKKKRSLQQAFMIFSLMKYHLRLPKLLIMGNAMTMKPLILWERTRLSLRPRTSSVKTS